MDNDNNNNISSKRTTYFDNTTKKHFTFRKGYVSLASGASSGTETI
nr:MAG TPA: hypothetical protein [Caudoviricetes sp.]